jgi:hypothetical protein
LSLLRRLRKIFETGDTPGAGATKTTLRAKNLKLHLEGDTFSLPFRAARAALHPRARDLHHIEPDRISVHPRM